MDEILFVNTCVRRESRTLMLAKRILSRMEGRVRELCPEKAGLLPLSEDVLKKRSGLAAAGDYSDELFLPAKQLASADRVVIAAPYWDFSFPAWLKVWIEQVTVLGLTFGYASDGGITGLCRCRDMIYVTTAGGYIGSRDMGFEYISEMFRNMYGVPECRRISAEGLDIAGADTDEILRRAFDEADRMKL